MEDISVLVFLANGTQITGHFKHNKDSRDTRDSFYSHRPSVSSLSSSFSSPSSSRDTRDTRDNRDSFYSHRPSVSSLSSSFSSPSSSFHPASPGSSGNTGTTVAKVADLRKFIDTLSPTSTPYQLLLVSPQHRPLDDPHEPLCTSSVVQVPGDKKRDDFDSDAEDTSSFYRRRVSTGVTLLSGPYYDQIMLAFMFTATNLVGVALLALIYFNVIMFWPYITPFFWAMVVGLALRPPRDKIVSYLTPLAKIEASTKSVPIRYFRKLHYVALQLVNNRNVPYIVVACLSYLMLSLIYTSMLGSWKPVVVGVSIFFALIILSIIVFSPPTFTAILLLGALVLLTGTLCIFATTSLFQEGLALLSLLEPYFKALSEKNLVTSAALLEFMGVGSEYQTVLEVVLNKLNNTAGMWGLNITTLSNFSNFSNLSNLTDLSAPTKLSNNLPGVAEFMNYDYSTFLEIITSSWAVTTRNVVFELSSWAFGTGLYALKVVARFSTSFYNMIISVTVFGTSLYLMLVSNKNWVADAVRMVPVANSNSKMYDQIQQVFTGIVLTTFVTCAANALFTYFIVCWGANFMFPFMYTFVNALITLFPVTYPWILQVPLVIHLYWGGQWVRGTGVSILFMILAYTDAKLYTMLAPSATSSSTLLPHQWISGLSVVMGLYAFGAQGILVGPVLVYITIILYKVFVDAMRDPRRRDSFLRRDSFRNFMR